MVSKTLLLLQEDSFPQFNKATFVKASSSKRQRSERPTNMKSKRVPRAGLRRAKSLPAHLQENDYTGKPLFWFARNAAPRKVPYQNLPAFKPNGEQEQGEATKPPRPLMSRLLGTGRRKLARGSNDEQPVVAQHTRNDSFETASTITQDDFIDDNDETFVDYSDDEEDPIDEEDEGGEDTLRGLSFLEEGRE